MPVTHFDMSTILAHRALDAVVLGPPQLPKHVALPGARQAVPHDRLVALQDAGNGELAVVARVNSAFDAEHEAQRAEHQQWVAGPYVRAIVEMREQQCKAAAVQQRREAELERITREREAAGA